MKVSIKYPQNLQQKFIVTCKTNHLIFTKLLFFLSLAEWLKSFGDKSTDFSRLLTLIIAGIVHLTEISEIPNCPKELEPQENTWPFPERQSSAFEHLYCLSQVKTIMNFQYNMPWNTYLLSSLIDSNSCNHRHSLNLMTTTGSPRLTTIIELQN